MNRWAFDLDGCVVDFMAVFVAKVKEAYCITLTDKEMSCYNIEEWSDLTREQAKEGVGLTIEDVDALQPYVGAIEFLKEYFPYRPIYFITSRKRDHYEATHQWLSKWMPLNLRWKVIFSNHKSKPAQEMNIHFMVEDKAESAIELADCGIKVFLMRRPWNQDCKEHPNIIPVNNWKEVAKFHGEVK